MLIEDSAVRERLDRMVRRLTSNTALRADLHQEALICLWQTQIQKPAQSSNWHLRNCRFHLLHYLSLGRSVDSPKRRACQVHPSGQEEEDLMDQFEGSNIVLQEVSASDILALLSRVLSPREKRIVHWLVEGLGTREIARQLNISHPMVVKHRRKIAALAAKLMIRHESANSPRNTLRTEESHRGTA